MMPTAAEFGGVPTEVWVEDGRVQITATDEATVYIQTPEQQPEAARDPEFTLFIKGDGIDTTVSLDLEQADALRRVLEDGENA